ncbi:MAG: hypothetical protein RIR62_2273 [Pseudomonadota bacterium]
MAERETARTGGAARGGKAASGQGGAPETPDRNAAIWFAADGYDPAAKGVNGRRMAGESFLRGWFRHAQVPEFVALTHGPTDAALFADWAREMAPHRPARTVRLDSPAAMAPVGAVWYSGPNYAPEVWRRAVHGATRWSMVGLTHTMSTKAVMQGVFDLRCAPHQAWDAVICTSRAVRAAMDYQLDQVDAYLRARFGPALPPRWQMPVIPLGVDCDAFRPDPAAGRALRARLGIAEGDVAALVVARLSPHEKFDPLPLYIALAEAQRTMPAGRRLHLVLYGNAPDDYSKRVFERGAAGLMPDVGYHPLPHDGAAARLAALSAADMFLFPIDNLQESFGIAPVEAMAAGLPVIASDWDGIRDTVDGAGGIRIPTCGARPEHTVLTGLRHFGGTDSYVQYLSQMSAVTQIDVPRLAEAIGALARDDGRRKAMGQAAAARARRLFDWSVVVPQVQDLIAELAAIRARADAADHPPVPPVALPVAPAPMALFAGFPTAPFSAEGRRFRAVALGTRPDAAGTLDLRDYLGMRRIFEEEAHVKAVLAAITAAGAEGAGAAGLARATGLHPLKVDRILLWLLKYHFIEGDP